MSRSTTSLIVLAALLALLFVSAPLVILIVFAGILLAVFLRGGGDWIATRLGIAPGWGVGIFALLVIACLSGAVLGFAPAIADQARELARQIPEAVEGLRNGLQEYPWGEELLQRINPQGLLSSGGGSAATAAVISTFGALGNFVIILFIGLYGALDTNVYKRGVRMLLAPALRARGEEVMEKAADTLRNWLAAQLLAMAVVGVLTGLGLWATGIPLAFILGLLAALLAFIPNIGPIIAAVPAVLLGLAEGGSTVFWVLAVYLVVQTLETYLITPLIQQESVSLPPALIIAAQLLFGIWFGLFGLALATPLAAVALTLTREIYISDYLERRSRAGSGSAEKQ